jgi:hypothetical protein
MLGVSIAESRVQRQHGASGSIGAH